MQYARASFSFVSFNRSGVWVWVHTLTYYQNIPAAHMLTPSGSGSTGGTLVKGSTRGALSWRDNLLAYLFYTISQQFKHHLVDKRPPIVLGSA